MTWYDADGLMWEGSDEGVTYKSLWKSKVFWFNVLSAVVMAAGAFGFDEFEPNAEWVALVMAVINIALRLLSNQPVTVSSRKVGTRAIGN